MAVDLKMPDIEMPDVSKLEIPIKVEKARQSLASARDSMRDTMRDRVSDSLPRRESPSPWPFIVGGLLAGMTIGYFLATSDWFAPRVKDAVGQARSRFDQLRTGANEDDLGPIVAEYEMTVTSDSVPPSDPYAPEPQDQQSYAI